MSSQNIILRPLKLEDINDAYIAWYENKDGHLNYFTGSGRVFTRDVLVDDFKEGERSKRWFYYIILNQDNSPIGNVKIGPIDIKNKTSDLVCLIGNRDFLGKGLASEAIRQAGNIAFSQHDIRRLQGGMYASNTSSIRAYTRAGWVIEGTYKGYYWINEQPEDRVCVACFNPVYFSEGKASL